MTHGPRFVAKEREKREGGRERIKKGDIPDRISNPPPDPA